MSDEFYNIIFNNYFEGLVKFARKYVSKTDAEDIAITVMHKLYELKDNFDNELKIKGFLFICVRNKCYNFLKRKCSRHYALNDDFDLPQEQHADIFIELCESFNREVSNLPKQQKQIMQLLFAGYSQPEIAKIINSNPHSVHVQKSRAIKKIKENLK